MEKLNIIYVTHLRDQRTFIPVCWDSASTSCSFTVSPTVAIGAADGEATTFDITGLGGVKATWNNCELILIKIKDRIFME